MESQVSFKFEGLHNKEMIINLLKTQIPKLKYTIEKEGVNLYRIYVGSQLMTKEEVFSICYGIQCNCVLNNSKEI